MSFPFFPFLQTICWGGGGAGLGDSAADGGLVDGSIPSPAFSSFSPGFGGSK